MRSSTSRLVTVMLSAVAAVSLSLLAFAPATRAQEAGDAGQEADATDRPAQESVPPEKPAAKPAAGLGRLPWVEGREEVRPTPNRLPSPRKTLEIFDIGDSQIDAFFDGVTMETDDEENLVRILDATRRFRPEDVARWEQSVDSLTALAEQPDKHRIEFYEIRGRVTSIETRKLLPEVARLFDFARFFLVNVDTEPGVRVRLCCLDLPPSWKGASDLNEPIRAAGLFLKTGAEVEGETELFFATPRIAWLPDAQSAFADLSASERYLATLNVDIGLLGAIRKRNGDRMGVPDREPFYQILAAAPQADRQRVEQLTAPFSLPKAIQTPSALQGQFFTVRGKARRITRVLIGEDEPDIRERFGIDHYYMIDFFIPLGDLSLQLRDKEGETASPIYQNGFPAIACVRSLPPALADVNKRLAERQSGEELLNEQIELTGVFFRLWSFRSEYVESFDPDRKQISPMFLAATVSMPPRPAFKSPYLGVGVSVVFIVVLAGVWFAVWKAGQSDRQFEQKTLRRRIPEPESLNDFADDVQDGPDFSGLE